MLENETHSTGCYQHTEEHVLAQKWRFTRDDPRIDRPYDAMIYKSALNLHVHNPRNSELLSPRTKN